MRLGKDLLELVRFIDTITNSVINIVVIKGHEFKLQFKFVAVVFIAKIELLVIVILIAVIHDKLAVHINSIVNSFLSPPLHSSIFRALAFQAFQFIMGEFRVSLSEFDASHGVKDLAVVGFHFGLADVRSCFKGYAVRGGKAEGHVLSFAFEVDATFGGGQRVQSRGPFLWHLFLGQTLRD